MKNFSKTKDATQRLSISREKMTRKPA